MSSTRLNIHHYASSATSHAHAAHSQLVFGLYGSLELEFEGRGASVDSTALAIIAPGDEHTYFSRDGGHCLVLDISPQQQLDGLNLNLAAQQRLLEKTTLHTLTPQQGSLVRSLAGVIKEQPGLAAAGASLLLASLLQQPAQSGRLPMATIDAYIDSHLAYPIEVGDLAQLARISHSRLRHWFALELGCSPTDYVRQRRLSSARQQLERGRDSIALIAERCGYGSQSAFAQAFKQCWGLSPSSARQRVAQATQNNMRARANSLQGR
ncbi:MAG TPA: AraC family transcriptional regulator [Pseudomonas sabulinigri]|uniref:HTH araC/xylS-type domain-containing protein n=1 Tax=marine sediment metagenome TaxID=412755 RepID=A0A0F9YTV7_9ZZZZ|nr:AraC family transcriptional regulator [Halopseudomonas sabulinigri]HEC52240.1 AraC family transcriptional regulator [Halopseudomonas sabulinigri]|tara:strand:+ start:13015 stop:13812 length:798 start_codon:yes stop_codon:yes gene_type:complete